MKKVININFQGRVIPIEETAYEILQRYVDSLRKYFANEEGKVSVIRAGNPWEILHTVDFGEGVHATPAIVAGRIYLRTDKHLYCFSR